VSRWFNCSCRDSFRLCLLFGIIALVKKQKPQADAPHDPNAKRVVLVNRRARHEYAIEETVEAGLVLIGTEVKSIRAGRANIQEAYCKFENGEAWLYNMHISPYEQGTRWNADPRRRRKLLLHRREIEFLRNKIEQKGLAVIPLALFFQRGHAKLELGVGRGKKLYDKREDIAKRDIERERQREGVGNRE
jgi:SsrA-binding protein